MSHGLGTVRAAVALVVAVVFAATGGSLFALPLFVYALATVAARVVRSPTARDVWVIVAGVAGFVSLCALALILVVLVPLSSGF